MKVTAGNDAVYTLKLFMKLAEKQLAKSARPANEAANDED